MGLALSNVRFWPIADLAVDGRKVRSGVKSERLMFRNASLCE